MTLKNLLGISLDTVAPDKALVGKLLAAARRNIADAQFKNLSAESRFDAAYKAIMQSAISTKKSSSANPAARAPCTKECCSMASGSPVSSKVPSTRSARTAHPCSSGYSPSRSRLLVGLS